MYRIMGDRPMTIRYLDPPLHEFLPTKPEDIAELAKDMGMTAEALTNVVESLHEFNPMMGHRGCRLAVSYPEIAEMQTTAVINAAIKVSRETGHVITPHIMVPLVGEVKELKFVKDIITSTADKLIAASGLDMKYLVGTMIEIPRAALTAGQIAKEAQFFSFGTNDLTQMTFGFSRDDAAEFLGAYYDNKIYESDPFAAPRSLWRRQADPDGLRRRTQDPPRSGAGHLRRAWRRRHQRGVLPPRRPELCVLQPLPRASGPAGRRAGRNQVSPRAQGVRGDPASG